MKKNMGSTDRLIRLLLALVAITLYVTNTVTGALGIALVVIAIIFLLTGMMRFCPLYLPFGINTCKTKKN